jgi:GR25 family glycosyltransferase involved in LPS biosynthesis
MAKHKISNISILLICIAVFLLLFFVYYKKLHISIGKIINDYTGIKINESMTNETTSSSFPKKGFVINLERNTDRYNNFMNYYKETDLALASSSGSASDSASMHTSMSPAPSNHFILEKYNAIDGKQINVENYLSPTAIEELHEVEKQKYRTKHYQLTRGGVGCFLSHFYIAKKLVNDAENISYIVFEDDIQFNPAIKYIIEKSIVQAPDDWDMLGFSYSRLIPNSEVKEQNGFIKPHAFWGMLCYIINKKGARKIVDEVEKTKIDGQIDSYLSVMCQEGKLNVYLYKEKLVFTNSKTTDIQTQLKQVDGINPYLYKGYLV